MIIYLNIPYHEDDEIRNILHFHTPILRFLSTNHMNTNVAFIMDHLYRKLLNDSIMNKLPEP